MKSLTPNFITQKELLADPASDPLWVLEIEASSTLFYADQPVTILGQEYEPLVTNWGNIKSQITDEQKTVIIGSTRITLSNIPILDNTLKPGQLVSIYKVYAGLVTADKVLLFQGVISGGFDSNFKTISFTCRDIGLSFNKQVGIILVDNAFGTPVWPPDIGKIRPIGYGTLIGIKPVMIDPGAYAIVKTDYLHPGPPNELELEDASLWPASGTIFEEFVTYSGKTNNTLTGLFTIFGAEYKAGQSVHEAGSNIKYLIFDHIGTSVTNIRVQVPNDNKEEYLSVSGTVNLNDSGRTTLIMPPFVTKWFRDSGGNLQNTNYHLTQCTLIVDAEAVPDDGSGTITGTPNALIEEPWHVIKHFLLNHSNGIVAADIDQDSFDEVENHLYSNYKFNLYVTKKTDLNSLASRMAFMTWSRFLYEAGKAKLVRIKKTWALTFNDTLDTRIFVAHDSSLNVVTDLSIEIQYKPPTAGWGTGSDVKMLVEKGDSASIISASASTGFTVAVDRTDNKVKVSTDGNSTVFSSVGSLVANQFNHIVVDITDILIDIYINGSLDNQIEVLSTDLDTTDDLIIGDSDNQAGRAVKGEIGKVALSATRLGPTNVTNLFNDPYIRHPVTPSIWIPFQDGHSTDLNLIDQSANAHVCDMQNFSSTVDPWTSGVPQNEKEFNTNTEVLLKPNNELSLKKQPGDLRDIRNKVNVKHELDNSQFGWDDENGYLKNNQLDDQVSIDEFGEKEETFLLFAVTDPLMALDLTNKILSFNRILKDTFELSIFPNNIELERGDRMGLTSSEYSVANQNYEIQSIDYSPPFPINNVFDFLKILLLRT